MTLDGTEKIFQLLHVRCVIKSADEAIFLHLKEILSPLLHGFRVIAI